MEHILNIYEGGVCGVWVNWLVNQHRNFPKFDKVVNTRWNLPVPVDLTCPGTDWDSDYTHFAKWPMEYGNNPTPTKRCIRYIGSDSDHGFLNSNGELNANLFIDVLQKTQIKKIIVIYTLPSDEYYSRLAYRWAYIKQSPDGNKNIDNFKELCNDTLRSYIQYATSGFGYVYTGHDVFSIIDSIGVDCLYLNISKLIAGDSLEYNKLLTFIDEEPLHNYVELAHEYREFMFLPFGSIMDIVKNDEHFYAAAILLHKRLLYRRQWMPLKNK